MGFNRVLVILAGGFEEMEAVTVMDVLRRAGVRVVSAALGEDLEVTGSRDIVVKADVLLSAIDPESFSAIVLPGGLRGVHGMLKSCELLDIVRIFAKRGKTIAAICAAPLVLDACGLLEGRRFTCHPSVADQIRSESSSCAASCCDGNLITGKSAGCVLEFALRLALHLNPELDQGFWAGLSCPMLSPCCH